MASSSGDPGELPRHLLHLSTLQLVTRASPFTHSRTLPLHTLSHLIQNYLGLLAQAAKDAAEHSGRDKISIWDVGSALEEFGAGTLADLKDEVERGDEGVGEEAQRIRELARGLKGEFAVLLLLLPCRALERWLTRLLRVFARCPPHSTAANARRSAMLRCSPPYRDPCHQRPTRPRPRSSFAWIRRQRRC